MRRRRQRCRFRDASVTLEFILVLPLLVVTLFGIAQFTVSLLVRQAAAQAAVVGAREAGKGEDIAEVARAVHGVLYGSHGIAVANVTNTSGTPPVTATVTPVVGSGVRVWLEVGQPDVVLFRPATSSFGDTSVPEVLPAPAIAANEVRVTVAINLARQPIYNWLYNFSPEYVDFSTRYLRVRSLVQKE